MSQLIHNKIIKMEECELIKLCDIKNVKKGNSIRLYWTSEIYGFGKWIRKYGYYPSFLPLAVYSDHSGPPFNATPSKHELENNAECFFCHNVEKKINYNNISTDKKAHVILSPNVFFRKYNNISYNKNAKGTIAFPDHSTPSLDFSNFDIENYCNELKALPSEFHPVKVCLHMHDINNGSYKKYLKNNIDVITVGHTWDIRFIERLYLILSDTKYITSNDIGTIALLSIEMDIPFFVYGNRVVVKNISDENLKKGVVPFYTHPLYEEILNSLKLNNNFILNPYPKELKYKVDSFLGVYDSISRKNMSIILYKSFFLWLFKLKFFLLIKKINA